MNPCGFVQFNDGHREAITLYHAYDDGRVRFNTATGRYLYQPQIENLEGFMVPHHAFMKIDRIPGDMWTDGHVDFSERYTEIDTIAMIKVFPEEDSDRLIM